jgi:MFS family permease
VLVDRTRKLPIIVATDLGRGVALAAVPACAWMGVLNMYVLYVVGFLIGAMSVIGWPAYQVFMTERVGRDRLVEANAKIGIADSAAQLVGPGLAGALIQWLTAPFAILFDAMAFVASALLLRGIPPSPTDVPKARGGRSIRADVAEGLRVIWRNPSLRALVWSVGAWQVFRHAFVATGVLFAARELQFSAGHVGALFMVAGLGSLVSTSVTERLNARFGLGPVMLAGLGGTGVAYLMIACSSGPYWLASVFFGGGLFVLDLAAMIFFINYLSLRQAAAPDALLGRVTATMIGLTVAAAPLGGLMGGWIAQHLGLRVAIVVAGVGALTLGALATWLSPIARIRELPRTQEVVVMESVAEETTW